MEFNRRYINALTSIFATRSTCSNDMHLLESVTFDKYNVFNKFFVVDLSSDEVDIPTFARAAIEGVIHRNLQHTQNVKKVVIPLYTNCVDQVKRTSDSIIYEFFLKTPFSARLAKVTTSKGEVYYGNKGMILDNEFNPLISCSIKCKKDKNSSNMDCMYYYSPTIRISPKVFLNDSGLISKTIIKKIIPFYLTHSISFISTGTGFYNIIPPDTIPQILIEDASRFIETPASPNPNTCTNEALNKLLIDNINDILNHIE